MRAVMRARSSGARVLKRAARAIHFCLRAASMPRQSCSSGARASRWLALRAFQRTPSSRAGVADAALAALPAELRARMRLVHYADTFDAASSVIATLREGDILRL